MKDYKIIDFHIHPHKGVRERDHLIISSERIKEELVSFGCYKACGKLICYSVTVYYCCAGFVYFKYSVKIVVHIFSVSVFIPLPLFLSFFLFY